MDTENRLNKILLDTTSGSSAILKQLINYITDPVNEDEWEKCVQATIDAGSRELKHFQVVHHFLESLKTQLPQFQSFDDLKAWLNKYEQYWSSLPDRWTATLAGIFKKRELTLSAHSQSESLKTVIYELFQSGKKLRVYQTQSGPLNEGELQAVWLAEKGVDVVLTTDALAPGLVRKCDFVLLGCDGIYSDGFVNKAGSLALCHAARSFEKPVFVLADSRKISHDTAPAERGRDSSEITTRTHYNMKVLNLYFEVIPHSLVTGYITEKGVLEENV